jgi:hypothetical protein
MFSDSYPSKNVVFPVVLRVALDETRPPHVSSPSWTHTQLCPLPAYVCDACQTRTPNYPWHTIPFHATTSSTLLNIMVITRQHYQLAVHRKRCEAGIQCSENRFGSKTGQHNFCQKLENKKSQNQPKFKVSMPVFRFNGWFHWLIG